MIGRKAHPKHPDDPTRCVFVPLVHDRHTGECVPILGPEGSNESELGAAKVCHVEWLVDWLEIVRLARHMRALCEHPNFAALAADGIDAGMVTSVARELAAVVELSADNVVQLFEPPSDDDAIRVGDVVHELDPETQFMVPVRAIESDQETQSPDTLLARYIRMSVRRVGDLLRQPISRRGLEHAIDALILMLPQDEDEDESTEREPSQFITDHRVARLLVTAIEKAEKRTGRRVSDRGYGAMIGVLERLRVSDTEAVEGTVGGAAPDEPGAPEVDGAVMHEIDDDGPAGDLDGGDGRGDPDGGGPDGGGPDGGGPDGGGPDGGGQGDGGPDGRGSGGNGGAA